jgi:hypothetical protein
LSLEEQRRRQKAAGINRFRARRRSSAATESKPSTTLLTPNARVIKANPFGLQVAMGAGICMEGRGGEGSLRGGDRESEVEREWK